MLITVVKKALKSVATTCDGNGGGECHVLFTKHEGTIINVDEMKGPYTVSKTGVVKGAGELTAFDRTGNTYGMEAWVYVASVTKPLKVLSGRSQLHELWFHEPADNHGQPGG